MPSKKITPSRRQAYNPFDSDDDGGGVVDYHTTKHDSKDLVTNQANKNKVNGMKTQQQQQQQQQQYEQEDPFQSDHENDSYSETSTDHEYHNTDNESDHEDGNEHNHRNNKSKKHGNNNIQNAQEATEATPVETSWQFLGDLPYRRVKLYDNIAWGDFPSLEQETVRTLERGDVNINTTTTTTTTTTVSTPANSNTPSGQQKYELFHIPNHILTSTTHHNLNPKEFNQYIHSTTKTLIASCPFGGPIATVTIPLLNIPSMSSSSLLDSTQIRIMTNAGKLLANIDFPPNNPILPTKRKYTAGDILSIGFTDKCILLIVLRDSYCLTYQIDGQPTNIPPFYILHDPSSLIPSSSSSSSAASLELIHVSFYNSGVAVISASMTCALVEILDEKENGDYEYQSTRHVASRIIKSTQTSLVSGTMDDMNASHQRHRLNVHWNTNNYTSLYALITPLSTLTHAKSNYITYTSIAVLPRINTPSRHPEVFIATSDNSVLIFDASTMEMTDINCRERFHAPIVQMVFAPNGRFLACFSQDLILTVISTNFETKVLDFDTSDGSSTPPHALQWCGEDSVVLYWRNLGVLMVGPYGDWLRFPYTVEYLHLSPEMDCLRVVTDTSVEILQRVPPATAAMLRIGSIEPSAMLLDASDAFDNGSASSDEAGRAIMKTGMLHEAIEVCMDAASKEIDITLQKRLLRAASYGMHFSYKDASERGVMGGSIYGSRSKDGRHIHPSPTAISFVETARKIRVLNALRHPSVGLALTVSQYDNITPDGIIARLILMKRPALATSLSTFLTLDNSVKAYARASRAAAFVVSDSGRSDSETAEAAMKILNSEVTSLSFNRGCYAHVALAAYRAGRTGVCNLLLTLESSVHDKVPALNEIGLYADAAAVGTMARNADLVFQTLLQLEKSCLNSTSDTASAQSKYLQNVVTKFPPEAVNLLGAYFASMQDVKHVISLYLHGPNPNHAVTGTIMAKRGLNAAKDKERLVYLQEASRFYGSGKDTAFQKSCTDDYIDLLSEQERLRSIYGQDVIPPTSSITTTIFNVIFFASKMGKEAGKLLSEAEKLSKRFKVPEKRLWHVKIRALAASGQWDNLKSLADSRVRPPVEFKHFAIAAIRGNQSIKAILRYIEKVTDWEERYDLFCEAKLWKRAIDEAKNNGDIARVMQVRSLANLPEIEKICDTIASTIA